MPASEALERMQRLASLCAVVPISAALALAAGQRSLRDQLSYWDALIVEAALGAGCRTLFSEDLQHGRKYGDLTVQNPYEPERPRSVLSRPRRAR
jgi:predicted nucleic acid-binding protein